MAVTEAPLTVPTAEELAAMSVEDYKASVQALIAERGVNMDIMEAFINDPKVNSLTEGELGDIEEKARLAVRFFDDGTEDRVQARAKAVREAIRDGTPIPDPVLPEPTEATPTAPATPDAPTAEAEATPDAPAAAAPATPSAEVAPATPDAPAEAATPTPEEAAQAEPDRIAAMSQADYETAITDARAVPDFKAIDALLQDDKAENLSAETLHSVVSLNGAFFFGGTIEQIQERGEFLTRIYDRVFALPNAGDLSSEDWLIGLKDMAWNSTPEKFEALMARADEKGKTFSPDQWMEMLGDASSPEMAEKIAALSKDAGVAFTDAQWIDGLTSTFSNEAGKETISKLVTLAEGEGINFASDQWKDILSTAVVSEGLENVQTVVGLIKERGVVFAQDELEGILKEAVYTNKNPDVTREVLAFSKEQGVNFSAETLGQMLQDSSYVSSPEVAKEIAGWAKKEGIDIEEGDWLRALKNSAEQTPAMAHAIASAAKEHGKTFTAEQWDEIMAAVPEEHAHRNEITAIFTAAKEGRELPPLPEPERATGLAETTPPLNPNDPENRLGQILAGMDGAVDGKRDGVVDGNEFAAGVAALSDADQKKLVTMIDTNGDGHIGRTERENAIGAAVEAGLNLNLVAGNTMDGKMNNAQLAFQNMLNKAGMGAVLEQARRETQVLVGVRGGENVQVASGSGMHAEGQAAPAVPGQQRGGAEYTV